MLYSRSLLVIHFKYTSVYMSTPNSLTIPSPYTSPLVTISAFSKSVSWSLKPTGQQSGREAQQQTGISCAWAAIPQGLSESCVHSCCLLSRWWGHPVDASEPNTHIWSKCSFTPTRWVSRCATMVQNDCYLLSTLQNLLRISLVAHLNRMHRRKGILGSSSV